MSSTLWGVLERVFQRGAGGVVSLVLAVITSPTQLGYFATVMLALTLYQAGSDTPLRQASPRALLTVRGRELVRHYIRLAPLVGVGMVGIAVVAVAGLFGTSPRWGLAASLSPLAVVPLVSALGIAPVARAQLAEGWRRITAMQLIASSASLAVTLPLIIVTQSLWACALQPLLAEGLLSLQARRTWSHYGAAPGARDYPGRDLLGTVAINLLSWGQGQLERLVLVLVGTVARVGEYALAVALARALGDAVLAGSANVLRAQASAQGLYGPAALRPVLTVFVRNLTVILLGVYVLLLVGVLPLLDNFVGPDWDEVLSVVPIIALAFFPAAVGWSLTAVFLHESAVEKNYPAQVVGLVLAVVVGLVLAVDLRTAAYVIVGRELVDVACKWARGPEYVSASALLVMLGGLAAGSLLVSASPQL